MKNKQAIDQEQIIKELAEDIMNEKEKVIFVFGAGASVDAGISLGKKLKRKID